jgi:RimJ/RimL family protein N-acetyltransferase
MQAFDIDLHPSPESSRRERPRSLSEALWGIDWERVRSFATAGGEIVAVPSSFASARPFIAAHYAAIFEEPPTSAFAPKIDAARERYYERIADFVEFQRQGETIGLFIGEASDWSTYYIRSTAVLPEYQGHGVAQHFFRRVLLDLLRQAGVERVELDTSPANLAMMQIVTRLRFNPTGTVLSERWGAQTRFTRFLSEASETVFLRQFCSGVKYQLRESVA